MGEFYEIPQVRGLPLVARWLEREIQNWPEVTTAKCRPSTGRLRVVWKEDVPSQKRSRAAIMQCLDGFSLQEAYGMLDQKRKERRRKSEDAKWHTYRASELSRMLRSNLSSGLSADDVLKRLRKFGDNTIPPVMPRSKLEILLNQFRNSPTALLGASAGVALLTGGWLEAGVILGVIGLNGAVGYWTESQSERALRSISQIGLKYATVIRDGHLLDVSIESVVPGDVIVLQPGARIPADARVIDADRLAVDESILTGESFSVSKRPKKIAEVETPVVDRTNMVFKGSSVVTGVGRAVVVETGMRTQAGRIQSLLVERFIRETSLERKFEDLHRWLVKFGVGSAGVLFLIGWWRGQPILGLFKTGVSMAIAAVPEGLPTVATWTLSQTVTKLLRQGVLVRDLRAIETLGALTTICFDKTGTLTENKMHVSALSVPWKKKVIDLEKSPPKRLQQEFKRACRPLMACAALCNDAVLAEKEDAGSPTELALLRAAKRFGISFDRAREKYPRLGTEYRSDYRRYMVTTHEFSLGSKKDSGLYKMMKGSPEEVLGLCSRQRRLEKVTALTQKDREKICNTNREMSASALRVLGFAYQPPGDEDWIWLGLMGLKDPPRPGMREQLARFHEAGIRTVMITGDQPLTAESIARDLNIANGERMITVDMSERNQLSDEELAHLSIKAHVFARVAPDDKKRIVEAVRHSGSTVGMVGDGINDSPALKASDVGIAIGKSGTEVAREVAGVVLMHDSLSDLLTAILMGRATGTALRKPVRYLVSTNLSELAVITSQMMMGVKTVLNPLQILWVNLVTDTLPALALASDPVEGRGDDLLRSGPLDPKAPFIARHQFKQIAKEVGVLSAMVLGSSIYGSRKNEDPAPIQTMAMDSLAVGQMLHALSCYSRKKIRWSDLMRLHRKLVTATLGSAGAHMVLTTLPVFNQLFKLSRLSKKDTAISVLMAGLGFLAIENTKEA